MLQDPRDRPPEVRLLPSNIVWLYSGVRALESELALGARAICWPGGGVRWLERVGVSRHDDFGRRIRSVLHGKQILRRLTARIVGIHNLPERVRITGEAGDGDEGELATMSDECCVRELLGEVVFATIAKLAPSSIQERSDSLYGDPADFPSRSLNGGRLYLRDAE